MLFLVLVSTAFFGFPRWFDVNWNGLFKFSCLCFLLSFSLSLIFPALCNWRSLEYLLSQIPGFSMNCSSSFPNNSNCWTFAIFLCPAACLVVELSLIKDLEAHSLLIMHVNGSTHLRSVAGGSLIHPELPSKDYVYRSLCLYVSD